MSVRPFGPLDILLSSRQKLFSYFGYVEDWRVLPVEDSREFYWRLSGEGYGDYVRFHEDAQELSDEREEDGQYYQDCIYTQRHLHKWVYRGKDFTMICVDTHTDGNCVLRVFDNTKELLEIGK